MKAEEYIIPINETAKDYDEMFVGVIRRQHVLIRCKDCKYYREGECWCENDNDGRKYYQSVIENPLPDDFCSYAERRDHDSD